MSVCGLDRLGTVRATYRWCRSIEVLTLASLQRRNWFLIGLVVGCLGGLLWIAVVSMMADPANIPHSEAEKAASEVR
jgi:hypothetical protein